MLNVCLALAAVLALLTLVHIYRGGTTLNDHIVAAIVTGTHAVYPLVALGAADAGFSALRVLCACAMVGNVGVWGLFFVLDRRVEVGRLRPLAMLSQPAHAFALWTGLLLCFWMPAVGAGRLFGLDLGHPLWPGPWLLVPAVLTTAANLWTLLRSNRRTVLHVPGPRRPFRIVQLSDL
ncbi:MAG: hypothetical protein VX000_16685, partial [Myxococcota bacterium]|nr:hypothetical protein [Myxococcota bacterium]